MKKQHSTHRVRAPNHNIALGKYGEDLAVQWLRKNGFSIIDRNRRYRRCEIDIVAEKNNILHSIEIKTRRNDHFGFPEQSITPAKRKNMEAATAALLETSAFTAVQMHVLAITIDQQKVDYYFLEDIGGSVL